MAKSQKITITDDVHGYVSWAENWGLYTWDNPGITVDDNVKATFELLNAVLSGGTVTVTRDGNGRVQSIAVSGYNTSTYDDGVTKLNDAIDSHDQISEGDGYTP